MSAWSARRLPPELLAEVNAGDVAMLTADDEHTPLGIVLPFPSDPEHRVREAAALLRAGAIGSSTAARLAGCGSIAGFIQRAGELGESIVSAETADEDLAIAEELLKRG